MQAKEFFGPLTDQWLSDRRIKNTPIPLSVGNAIRERSMDKLLVEIQFDITKFSVIGFVLTGLFVVNESACLPYIDSS